MVQQQSITEWARTAHFSTPLRWGEVEAGILARDPAKGEGLPLGMWVRVALAWVGITVFGCLTAGASVIGLVLVAVGSIGDDASWGWVGLAMLAFAMSTLTQAALFRMWFETRRRNPAFIPVSALSVVASIATYVVLVLAADESGVSWLPVFVIVAALSAGLMLVLALRSKPEGREKSRKPPRRGPRNSARRSEYTHARARVLAILRKRGLVHLDEADEKRILEMPLGYWEELDGVDEKERRRILEYRLVGWRDFDASDKRPWPPAER